MQSIFAEAYQMSLGKSGDQILVGQKALEELYGAMEKGNVYAAKVLPFVEEIAKRMAIQGLGEARNSANAAEARFHNSMSDGWKVFGENGGQQGRKEFWQMMQIFSDWFKNNADTLGGYFLSMVRWLNVFRITVRDIYSFFADGEGSQTVDLLEQWGINLGAWKESFSKFKNELTRIFKDDNSTWQESIAKRISAFSNGLMKILDATTQMLSGIITWMEGFAEYRKLGTFGMMMPLASEEGRAAMSKMQRGGSTFFGGAWDALSGGTDAILGAGTGVGGYPTDYNKFSSVYGYSSPHISHLSPDSSKYEFNGLGKTGIALTPDKSNSRSSGRLGMMGGDSKFSGLGLDGTNLKSMGDNLYREQSVIQVQASPVQVSVTGSIAPTDLFYTELDARISSGAENAYNSLIDSTAASFGGNY